MELKAANEQLKNEIIARYAVKPRVVERVLSSVPKKAVNCKRILLVYPPKHLDASTAYGESFAIALLHRKAEAEAQGWTVKIFNATKAKNVHEELAQVVAKFHPTVVGFSSTSSSQGMSFELAKKLHDNGLGEGRVFVMGGPGTTQTHPHIYNTLNNRSPIDAFFLGDGRESFSQLLEKIGTGRFSEVKDIPNLSLASEPATKISAKPDVTKRKLISPLEYIRLNERAYPVILGEGNSPRGKQKIARIQTMGNCAFGCGFCAISNTIGAQTRLPVQTVVNHMRDLVSKGIRNFYFEDATFIIDSMREEQGVFTKVKGVEGQEFKGWTNTFLSELANLRESEKKRKREIRFGIQTRLDTLNETTIPKLAAAGCTNVFLGVETLAPTSLREMHKGTNNQEASLREKFKLLNEHGINPTASLIVGKYTGGLDNLRYTLEKMREFNVAEIFLQAAAVYPGTGDWKKLPEAEQDHVALSYLAPNHAASLVSTAHMNDEDKLQYHKWDDEKSLRGYYAIVPGVLGRNYVQVNPGHYLRRSLYEKHKEAFKK